MSESYNPGPVNPVSPAVVALFLAMLVIEIAFTLGNQGVVGGPGAVGWRAAAIQAYGFNGPVFDWMVTQGRWPTEHVMRFVTYLFVHGSITHMVVAGVILLALGKFVGDVFAWWAVLVVFFGAGIGGAAVWGLVLDDPRYLIGAFPGVYGLIGAFTYVIWLRLGQTGESRARAFALIGMLAVIQLVFGLYYFMIGVDGGTEWLADLAGFGCGFLLSFVVSPGGWQRLREKLRHD
ncbi:rhomboid family intramembrane serine protease [Marimonas lutisalis]|uniref:rhomboid family intramembrane serine protease n=1 Tax=Marimonas lutisalis TaxID=2545756 RepID=UPI0010F4A8F9|nr:rhomboid family intramembrane serine protease [Marimonas lutisalis]